jgi:SAM-dependent methyltransferase
VNDSSVENLESEAEYHKRAFQDLFQILVDDVSQDGLKGKLIADIGSGFGHWLDFLRDNGVSSFGVEPVEEGVTFTREKGLNAFQVGIEELQLSPGGKIDIVTMLNVLEHLRNPLKTLIDLRAGWLVDEGRILIRVPNDFNILQLAANEIHNLNSWWVAPPRHINYFSVESLSHVLDLAGYNVLSVTSTFPLEMFLLMGEVYVGDQVVGKTCHRKRVQFEQSLEAVGQTEFRRRLYSQLANLGIGREIIVLAQAKPM